MPSDTYAAAKTETADALFREGATTGPWFSRGHGPLRLCATGARTVPQPTDVHGYPPSGKIPSCGPVESEGNVS